MKNRIAALVLMTACAGAAQAHSGDVLVGVAAGTVIGSAISGGSPGVSITYGYGYPYAVYAPPPVVYAPPPAVIYPAPRAMYGPPYGNAWGYRHHHHRDWDDRDGRNGRGHGRW
ncbi:MAG: hypothetical protein RL404_1086 [Pseudomonadota bacterium]